MKRLKFSGQVKEDAVRFMRESNKSAEEVAKTVGVTAHTLRAWARQININSGKGPESALTVSEKEELSLLRRECRELRREVFFKAGGDILRKSEQVKFEFIKENSTLHRTESACQFLHTACLILCD